MSKGMTRITLQLFTLEDIGLTTRTPEFTPEIVGSIFKNTVVSRWNRLDQETVEATSLDVFKCRLTTIRKKHEDICFFMD